MTQGVALLLERDYRLDTTLELTNLGRFYNIL